MLQAQGESPAARRRLKIFAALTGGLFTASCGERACQPEEAKDVTQGFFALILERKDFQSVRQEKGRLRSFLLAALKHFMANERRDARTIKRAAAER